VQQGLWPIFGGIGQSYDLVIRENCSAVNSYSDFPISYNMEGPNKYEKGQKSKTAFSGATENRYFIVEDYEVFSVHYD